MSVQEEFMHIKYLIKAIRITHRLIISSSQVMANVKHQQRKTFLFHAIGEVCTYLSYVVKLLELYILLSKFEELS